MSDAWIFQVAHSQPGAPVAVQFRSGTGTVISVVLEPDADLGDADNAVAFARKMLGECASHVTTDADAPKKARPSYETDELYRFWATGR